MYCGPLQKSIDWRSLKDDSFPHMFYYFGILWMFNILEEREGGNRVKKGEREGGSKGKIYNNKGKLKPRCRDFALLILGT